MAFRAVLFDFGHTLFYPPDRVGLLVEAGVERERAQSIWSEIWRRAMTPEELARGRDLDARAHRENWVRLFGLADAEAPGISERLYEESLPERWLPYPDTRPVLEELHRRGADVGVLSNVATPLRGVLEQHGLGGFVGSITHSYELGVEKPDRRIFGEACRRRRPQPALTLMVGDNAYTDGAAALAGLTALILPPAAAGEPRGLEAVLGLVAP